jgi:hypothetical protein
MAVVMVLRETLLRLNTCQQQPWVIRGLVFNISASSRYLGYMT